MYPRTTDNPIQPPAPKAREFRNLAWASTRSESVLLPTGAVQLDLQRQLAFTITDPQRLMLQTGIISPGSLRR